MNNANPSLRQQGKFVLAAVMIAGAMNLSWAQAMQPGVPAGWQASGDAGTHFEIGIDPGESSDGHVAVFIASKDQPAKGQFAAISQTIDVTPWPGKTVRFTMMAKVQEPASQSEVFLRGTAGKEKSYSSVMSTNIKGSEWKEVSLAMDINKDISQLEFGIGLRQQGKLWLKDVRITALAVPPKTVATKHDAMADHMPVREPAAAPVNLDFSR